MVCIFFRSKRVLTRHYYNGMFFNSANSLQTSDQCMDLSLLRPFSSEESSASLKDVHTINNMLICELDNVLTEEQCDEIIESSSLYKFQDMGVKYDATKERNNSRLLVLDSDVAKYLSDRIEETLSTVIRDHSIPLVPLGFDVLRGNWEFSGLNEALRINKYSAERREFFACHKDAQYCPSGDERSILSLVLYLNEGFKGGETCFYLPKNREVYTKGMTVDEEIRAHGGLDNGFHQMKISPVKGSAVLFSQNILHESIPLEPQQTIDKFILKTDFMLKRKDKPFGFSISIQEKEDYFKSLNYFREAQQKELVGDKNEASQFYERALSLRYCYPAALSNSKPSNSLIFSTSATNIFPYVVWGKIFFYLNGQDAERLVYAFPDLRSVKILQDQRFASILQGLPERKRPKFYPKVEYQQGIYTCFKFSDADFFESNVEGCCRVAAMYSFFLLGQSPSDKMYPVRFNPDTQEVCVMPLDTLLWSAFYNEACYGAIYKVKQQDKKENPKTDFAESVDRNYMSMRHSAEFIGVDLADNFRVKTTGFNNSDDELTDSDDELPDSEDKFTNKDAEIYLRMIEKLNSHKNLHIGQGGKISEEIIDIDRNLEVFSSGGFLYPNSTPKGKKIYLDKLLLSHKERACVSAAIVSSIDESVCIDGRAMCCCFLGVFGQGCSQFADECKQSLYNHLVFDFQESKMVVVAGDGSGSACISRCYLDDVLSRHVNDASAEKEMKGIRHGKMKRFTVKIDALAEGFQPFNHASCQCGFPSFEVDEYVSLKDYPFLNHIHLMAQQFSDEMFVWSVYCGIAAL